MGRVSFKELSHAKVKDNLNVVISEKFVDGEKVGYKISEQVVFNEGTEEEKRVFLKGGIDTLTIEGLTEFRNAVLRAFAEIFPLNAEK